VREAAEQPTARSTSNREPETTCEVHARRIETSHDGTLPPGTPLEIAVESPITIEISHNGTYTLMCSPRDQRALAAGFLFTEGLIASVQDIGNLQCCPDNPNTVRAELLNAGAGKENNARNLVVMSSCGLCGTTKLDTLLARLQPIEPTLAITATGVRAASEALSAHQSVYPRTGGTHAAAVFNAAGTTIAFAEDIGRHNALDKAIGMCLLSGRTTDQCGVALSGRVSLEMVLKCARARLQIITAVSAPTSLAVHAAQHARITLCAFVRNDHATVFTHPERIRTPDDAHL